ncbi:uncharacterized protein LOC127846055 [Dreissena polymorpha]|uniref:uncharacterized protein LOC127846055 n=1 Tax=Dreissena polymorpha TaxID=45954 RepID=UPI0022652E03|nr:uncharacterized protein LOC127846055 [Dreissena polymorpha]
MSESESSLYSRHSQNYAESVSVEICSILTRLGYGEEIRRWRIKKYREFDRLVNARRPDLTMITAGSKAEGLTCRLESDWDILQVLNKVLCVEAGTNLRTIPCDMEVYRMDTCAYPGHCKLFLERQALGYYNELHRALYDNGNASSKDGLPDIAIGRHQS